MFEKLKSFFEKKPKPKSTERKITIYDVPNDVLLLILAYLKPNDLCHMAQVSKLWKFLSEHNSLWKVFRKDDSFSSFPSEKDAYKHKFCLDKYAEEVKKKLEVIMDDECKEIMSEKWEDELLNSILPISITNSLQQEIKINFEEMEKSNDTFKQTIERARSQSYTSLYSKKNFYSGLNDICKQDVIYAKWKDEPDEGDSHPSALSFTSR